MADPVGKPISLGPGRGAVLAASALVAAGMVVLAVSIATRPEITGADLIGAAKALGVFVVAAVALVVISGMHKRERVTAARYDATRGKSRESEARLARALAAFDAETNAPDQTPGDGDTADLRGTPATGPMRGRPHTSLPLRSDAVANISREDTVVRPAVVAQLIQQKLVYERDMRQAGRTLLRVASNRASDSAVRRGARALGRGLVVSLALREWPRSRVTRAEMRDLVQALDGLDQETWNTAIAEMREGAAESLARASRGHRDRFWRLFRKEIETGASDRSA